MIFLYHVKHEQYYNLQSVEVEHHWMHFTAKKEVGIL